MKTHRESIVILFACILVSMYLFFLTLVEDSVMGKCSNVESFQGSRGLEVGTSNLLGVLGSFV